MEAFPTVAPRAIRDSVDMGSWDPSFGYRAENMYPLDPDIGHGGWLGRPGYTKTGTGTTRVQRTHQFSKLDGTEQTVKVDAGQICDYNWSTDTWTLRITTAQLSSASITLASTGLVYAVTYNNKVIFNDGTNQPFAWDGTAGGGLTLLSNAPSSAYGQPVVYFAKLVFLKTGSERNTFAWSEENAENTGYEAGGYNNSWTLGQTDQEPIYALAATEEALVYLRARSTGAVWGRMNAEFQTTGTHEAISPTLGTKSPNGVVVDGNRVWFVDARGRPQRFVLGGSDSRPIWEDCRETLKNALVAQLGDVQTVRNPVYRMVQFAVTTSGTEPDQIFNFSQDSGEFLGVWKGLTPFTLDMVKDGDGRPTLMHGESDGNAFKHADPEDGVYLDTLASSTAGIAKAFETAPLGYDSLMSKVWDRVDLALRLQTNLQSATLKITTPDDQQAIGLPTVTGAGSAWDTFKWDVDAWGGGAFEKKIPIGLDTHGRWARFAIEHSEISQQIGFFSATAQGYDYDSGGLKTA